MYIAVYSSTVNWDQDLVVKTLITWMQAHLPTSKYPSKVFHLGIGLYQGAPVRTYRDEHFYEDWFVLGLFITN